jgi:hypothetical protein
LFRTHGALAAYRRALAIKEAAFGPDDPRIANTLGGIGTTLAALGQLERALALIERARTIKIRALGPDHPSVAVNACVLGDLLLKLGKTEASPCRVPGRCSPRVSYWQWCW